MTETLAELINRGVKLHKAGKLDQAAVLYRQVLARDPDHVNGNQLLGMVAKQQGDLKTAVTLMEKALSRKPDYPEVQYNLANTYWELEEVDKALVCYNRSLEGNPGHENALINKGRALQQMGRSREAAHCLRQAIRFNPDSGKAWENLSLNAEDPLTDTELEQLRAVLGRMDPRAGAARYLHFALGNAWRARRNNDMAFVHYAAGNHLASLGHPLPTTEYQERAFDNITDRFDASRLSALRGGGNAGERPIFVLGMPRSGTTLVEQILVSHPRVMAGGERHDLQRTIEAYRARRNPGAVFPEWVTDLEKGELTHMGQGYLDRLPKPARPGQDRITDKMMANYRYIGLIHLALPKAKIIHVRRSPADNCLSCFLQNFTNGHHYSFDQFRLGLYYRAYHRLMANWRNILPETAFLDVRYEDVVAEPAAQVERLLAYCGLGFDEACLRFFETDRTVRTASMNQVRQPIYKKAVARWRRYAPFLGPLFTALGDLAPDLGSDPADFE